MSPRLLSGLGLALALCAPAAAQSFNAGARPVAGTLNPRADRAPEMADLTIRGATPSGRDECPGFFDPAAPDAVVDWRGGRLRLTVRSSTDATLAVVDEQGQWHCNDDAEGLAPVVDLPGATRGRYAVWVGSFAEGGGGAATLIAGSATVAAALDADADPQEQIRVEGGFSATETVERTVTAGGVDAVSTLDLGSQSGLCGGFVDAAHPTARVRYTAGGPDRLTFRATTDTADPVLLVRTPGGEWLCDDDSGEGANAALAVDAAASGDYTVWVGTFSSLARTEATTTRLAVLEEEVVDPDLGMDFDDMDYEYEPTPYSTGSYRPLDTDAMPQVRLALGTDAAVSAGVTVQPDGLNPVVGDVCRGQIEAGPTAAVTMAGDGPVGLTATGDRDLVLVVLTPGGEWFCSDDADGLNPGIQIDTPMAGTYRVWVGAFAEGQETVEATLSVSRGEITVTQPEYGMDAGVGTGPAFADGVYDGAELLVGQPVESLTDSMIDGLNEVEAAVVAGGPLLNPVAGPTCSGFVAARPSAAIVIDGDLTFSASPAAEGEDLVLLVHTPDGRWICGDDANGEPDPLVTVEGGAAGTYSVWVGTFSRRTTGVEATLSVRR